MLSKNDCIKKLESMGFNKDEIINTMNALVKNMHSVTIGKYKMNCIYNGTVEWKFKGNNSKDLNDYVYSVDK